MEIEISNKLLPEKHNINDQLDCDSTGLGTNDFIILEYLRRELGMDLDDGVWVGLE